MAEIAKPITRLLLPRSVRPASQIDEDFQVLFGENLRRARLIYGLGLAVYDELEGRGPVGRDEADGCSGRDDGAGGGEALGVADCAEDAAPVCVFAVQGGLDEGVTGDGGGDEFGVGEGGGVDDFDPDELGGALAVADDELGELLGEGCEDALHCEAVGGSGRGDGRAAGGAVGEDGEGVVGAGAAVYAYGVEGPLDGVGEERLEG